MARRYTRPLTTPAAARIPRDGGRPLVSLLTDFGARDPSAAICRGVVLGIAPDALIVDISHEVEKYNISHGALLLWCALPYLPVGVHVAVIDPGVGTDRRPICLEVERGDHLVGPDNGLLLPAAERLGGVRQVHLIESPQYRLPAVSATFHGRDVFAPAAAHLAMGVPLESIGRELDGSQLSRLDWPVPSSSAGRLETAVIYVDTFGNVKLAALGTDFRAAFAGLRFGDSIALAIGGDGRRRRAAIWAQTFGDAGPGELLLYEDSYGRLCIALREGHAAATLGLTDGTRVTISPPARRASSPRERRALAAGEEDQAAG